MDIGLLIIRIALGGAMFLQGAAKLTWYGRRGTAEYFESVGLRPPALLAVVAGVTEVGAGIFFGVGFATPIAAAGLIAVLVSAVAVKAPNGYWNTGDGFEYPLLAGFVVAATAFSGPGAVSVDALLGWATPSTLTGIGATVAGIAAAVPLLVRRAAILRARPAVTALTVEAI